MFTKIALKFVNLEDKHLAHALAIWLKHFIFPTAESNQAYG